MRKILLLLLSAIVVSGNMSAIGGVSFQVPFDENCTPKYNKGSHLVKGGTNQFVAGRVKKSIRIDAQQKIEYSSPGNIDFEQGTLSFWYKPEYNPSKQKQAIQILRAGNLNLTLCENCRVLFFMTASVKPPKGFVWDYGTAARNLAWKQNEWYHIAISWDLPKQKKKLYINGKKIIERTTEYIDRSSSAITLYGGAGACFDELIIYNKPLSDQEVSSLCKEPGKNRILDQDKLSIEKEFPVRADFTKIKSSRAPVSLVCAPGEVFPACFELVNNSNITFKSDALAKLEDVRGKLFGEKKIAVTLAPGERKTFKLPYRLPQLKGAFKVALYFNEHVIDVDACVSWPENQYLTQTQRENSFFGNHVRGFEGKYLTLAGRLGLGWQRVHDMLQFTWWNRVQPNGKEFKWGGDSIWNGTKKYNMPVLGCINGPSYCSPVDSKGGKLYKVTADMQAWRKYVKETVLHYSPSIKYWEIYNEPSVPLFWNGTPGQLVELVNSASDEIKKANPEAVVMAAGFVYCSWNYHEACAKLGILKKLDIISTHYCPSLNDTPDESLKKTKDIVDHFAGLWEKYGVPGKPFRLWSTESSIGSTSWFRGLKTHGIPPEKYRIKENSLLACKRIIQGVVIMQSLGIEKHFYYWFGPLPLGERSWENTSMIDVTDVPRPKQMARLAMERMLADYSLKKLVRRESGDVWFAIYGNREKTDESMIIQWCGDAGEVKNNITYPKNTKMFDMMSNPIPLSRAITDEPEYFHIPLRWEKAVQMFEKSPLYVKRSPEKSKEKILADALPSLPDFVIPSENPSGVKPLDLKSVCNMGLADERAGDGIGGWADEGPFNDMRSLNTGRQTFYGVPFEIIDPKKNKGKAIITLKGRIVTGSFPEKVVIPVNSGARAVYFLHSTSYGENGKAGEYIITYNDNTSVVIENNIPETNGNWWNGYYGKIEQARPVPITVSNTYSGKPETRFLRVFEWQNPNPAKPIRSITAVSAGKKSTPILIAITICK